MVGLIAGNTAVIDTPARMYVFEFQVTIMEQLCLLTIFVTLNNATSFAEDTKDMTVTEIYDKIYPTKKYFPT